MSMTRRDFTRSAALVGTGAAATVVLALEDRTLAGAAELTGSGTIRQLDPSVVREGAATEDLLIRMQRELARAMAKPVEQRSWVMVIDARKCIGCNACTVACIAENNLPPGVTYRTVFDEIEGDYPNLRRFLKPTNCFQCANPPCATAANAVKSGSMSIRPDGIVAIDYRKMKGRGVFDAAKKACPYGYALYFDTGGNFTDGTPAVQPYEKRESVEYGQKFSRADTVGVTRKCHFCLQRIEGGALPACVTTCTGQAMHFGDRNDPTSLASELLAKKQETFVVDQAAGTGPRVIYLNDEPENDETSCAMCHDGGNLE